MVLFSFMGGAFGHGRLAAWAWCFLSVCFLSVYLVGYYQVIMFSELKNVRGDAKKINQEPRGQVSSCLSTP